MINFISVTLAFFHLFVVSRFGALPMHLNITELPPYELVVDEISTFRQARRAANQVNPFLAGRLITVVHFDAENDIWRVEGIDLPLTTGGTPGVIMHSDGRVFAIWFGWE